MKLKLALSTATAMGLLMGAALAASNDADVKQYGTNGYTNVSQSGNSNQADVDQNSDALRNRATVTQSGNSGQVGLEQGGGSDNEAVFTQSGTGNFIGDDSTDPAQGPIVQGGSDNDLEHIHINPAHSRLL